MRASSHPLALRIRSLTNKTLSKLRRSSYPYTSMSQLKRCRSRSSTTGFSGANKRYYRYFWHLGSTASTLSTSLSPNFDQAFSKWLAPSKPNSTSSLPVAPSTRERSAVVSKASSRRAFRIPVKARAASVARAAYQTPSPLYPCSSQSTPQGWQAGVKSWRGMDLVLISGFQARSTKASGSPT